jgi:hypothetical protein
VYQKRIILQHAVQQLEQKSLARVRIDTLVVRMLAELFLYVSNAVMRDRELDADRFAAAATSTESTIRTLVKLDVLREKFRLFTVVQMMPLLRTGERAPVMEGFSRYLLSTALTRSDHTVIKMRLVDLHSDDTHPSTLQRIAQLRSARMGTAQSQDEQEPASSLVNNGNRIERLLYTDGARTSVEWESVIEVAFLPYWERELGRDPFAVALLAELTIADLPRLARKPLQCAVKLRLKPGKDGRWEPATTRAHDVLGKALTIALARDGWTAQTCGVALGTCVAPV